MIKFYLLIVSLVVSLTMTAKDNPEDYHVKAILADGTIIEGYNQTAFRNMIRPWVTEVSISDTFEGTAKKYSSDELKTVWFTKLDEDSIPKIFHAIKAQKRLPNLFNKNPKPYKKPAFLRLIYDGENVKGYALPITDHTLSKTITVVNYTWMYYYMTKDSDVAVAYWDDTDGIVPNMRKVMKFYLRAFPELVRMVDSGELTPEMFRKNPTVVLPLMDATYKSEVEK